MIELKYLFAQKADIAVANTIFGANVIWKKGPEQQAAAKKVKLFP